MALSHPLQFVLLLTCHVAGVSMFIIGFLLTRTVVPEYSPSCKTLDTTDTVQSPCHFHHDKVRFKKVVWILIDALRYDFVVYDDSLNPNPPPYRNKMPHVNKYLVSKPEHTKLYRFIADPPTTTMQRLKALTTGSLPTFVDIGSNFNSYEITEDNLLLQCKQNDLRVTFMGDDTWLGLYPRLIDKSFPYPSLNVKDLHTVDNGVIEQMLPELKQKDGDFVIGHLLGVDHCGHTYGPSQLLMALKLRQMDAFIRDVFSAVTNDTIVFVFGDHGMTITGDHGGETPLETDSALLVYSPISLFDPKKVINKDMNSIYQTDIVPTVSLLLGIPIPFSSLGIIISDLFLKPRLQQQQQTLNNPLEDNNVLSTLDYLHALNLNMEQIYLYMKTLIEYDGTFLSSSVDLLLQDYHSVRKRYNDIVKTKSLNETKINSVITGMREFIGGVRTVCTEKWAKFNDVYIYTGIALLLMLLIIICGMIILQNDNYDNSKRFDNGLLTKLKFVFLTDFDWTSILSLVLIIFHSFSFFSNSFVVFEQEVVAFSYQTLIVAVAYKSLRQFWITKTNNYNIVRNCCRILWPYFAIMACIRLSSLFHSCRDQQDECVIIEFLQPFNKYNGSSFIGYLVRAFFLALSVFFYRMVISYSERTFVKYLSCNKKYENILFSLSFEVTRGLIMGIIALILLDGLLKIVSVTIAWIIYITFIIGLVGLIWKPWLLAEQYIEEIDWSQQQLTGANNATTHCLFPLSWLLMLALTPIVMIVAVPNDAYVAVFVLMILQLTLTIRILQDSPQVSLVTRAVLCSLFVDQYFFGLGHQATVNSLRFEAGFIGIYGNMNSVFLILAGILVGINTLALQILGSIILPLLLPYKHIYTTATTSTATASTVMSSLFRIQLMYIGVGSLKLFCCALCASMLRRHLMLWAVFGPRVMYEAAFQSLSIVITTLINLFVQRSQKEFEKCKQNYLEKIY